MNPNIQEQLSRITQFNETESRKMIEIKKLLTSKLFLIMIISLIISVVALVGVNIYNGITFYITPETENIASEITYIVFNSLLSGLVPAFFISFCFILREKAKLDNTHSIRDSVLRKLLTLRSFVKFYFIVMIISFVSTGITYNNLEIIQQYDPLTYEELLLEGSVEMLKLYGINGLINAGLFACCWYALSRASKLMANSIILDLKDRKYYEVFVFIAFLVLIPLIDVIGIVLGLLGVATPLTTVYFVPPIIPSDYLLLVSSIISLISICLVAYVFIKLRNILMTVSGSTNPFVDNDNVYTVNLTEEDKI